MRVADTVAPGLMVRGVAEKFPIQQQSIADLRSLGKVVVDGELFKLIELRTPKH